MEIIGNASDQNVEYESSFRVKSNSEVDILRVIYTMYFLLRVNNIAECVSTLCYIIYEDL